MESLTEAKSSTKETTKDTLVPNGSHQESKNEAKSSIKDPSKPKESNQVTVIHYNSYEIAKIFPSTDIQASVMEELVFKCVVRLDPENLSANSMSVEVITNLKHLKNMEGQWETLELPYRDAQEEYHVYGQVVVLVEEGVYEFIFKSKTICEKKGMFHPEPGKYFSIFVKPPSNLVIYADLLRVPYMSHMIGPIWLGNEWAGLQSQNNGFTHVLCLDGDLQPPSIEDICFSKAPIPQGVKHVINKETIKRALTWIKRSLRDGYKILIYSKYGFGRTGSIMIAFVMMENREVSYEEAYEKTFARRPVLPHKHLKKTCESLYRSAHISPGLKKLSKVSKDFDKGIVSTGFSTSIISAE